MSSPYEVKEAELQRKPIYKAVFTRGRGSPLAPVTFSTHKVRINLDYLEETDTVDELFAIDENKQYNDEFFSFPRVDHSPLGDMFPFLNIWQLATSSAYMALPSMTAPMQIIPEQAHCSVGAVELVIEDTGEEMTALVASNIIGQRVRVYGGFHDLDEDDYAIAYTGTVESVRMTSNLSGYRIELRNTQARVNRRLFQVVSFQNAREITDATTSMTFDLTVDQFNSLDETGYVLIDSEVIRYEKAPFFEYTILERAAYGSIQSDHELTAAVHEIIPIGPAHPIDIVLGIYYGTASKTCLGLEYDDIDWMAFQRARDIIGASYQMQFFVAEADNALDWLSREIFLPLGMYPFVTADNKVSIKAFAAQGASTVTFDHDSIVAENGRPILGWGLSEGNLGLPINDVQINYDLNPVTGEWHSFFHETRPSAIDRCGRFPVVINAAGLRFNIAGTAQLIVDRVAAILDRYQDGVPILTARTHLQKQGAEVGDTGELTSPFIPNRNTGTRGVTAAEVEIINRSVQWDDGHVEYTLLGADSQL